MVVLAVNPGPPNDPEEQDLAAAAGGGDGGTGDLGTPIAHLDDDGDRGDGQGIGQTKAVADQIRAALAAARQVTLLVFDRSLIDGLPHPSDAEFVTARFVSNLP